MAWRAEEPNNRFVEYDTGCITPNGGFDLLPWLTTQTNV